MFFRPSTFCGANRPHCIHAGFLQLRRLSWHVLTHLCRTCDYVLKTNVTHMSYYATRFHARLCCHGYKPLSWASRPASVIWMRLQRQASNFVKECTCSRGGDFRRCLGCNSAHLLLQRLASATNKQLIWEASPDLQRAFQCACGV